MAQEDFLAILKAFPKKHDLLIAFDSDGCVFDTMTLKQTRVFHPMTMEFWQLWPIETYVRETAEFFNLFSQHRGRNRFLTQSALFHTIGSRAEVQSIAEKTGLALPDPTAIDLYVGAYEALGDSTLREFVSRVSKGEKFDGQEVDIWAIHKVLGWSEAINRIMPYFTEGVEPYPHVRESLEETKEYADLMVVSQTPVGARRHEWKANSIDRYVHEIAGQEMGKKWQHLQMAIESGGYESGKVLMVGDADGDKNAADKASEKTGARVGFYPTIPGREVESWASFPAAARRFRDGTFDEAYQRKLNDAFSAALPPVDHAPWLKEGYDHQRDYKPIVPLRKK